MEQLFQQYEFKFWLTHLETLGFVLLHGCDALMPCVHVLLVATLQHGLRASRGRELNCGTTCRSGCAPKP